jgi:hypothetical protein
MRCKNFVGFPPLAASSPPPQHFSLCVLVVRLFCPLSSWQPALKAGSPRRPAAGGGGLITVAGWSPGL